MQSRGQQVGLHLGILHLCQLQGVDGPAHVSLRHNYELWNWKLKGTSYETSSALILLVLGNYCNFRWLMAFFSVFAWFYVLKNVLKSYNFLGLKKLLCPQPMLQFTVLFAALLSLYLFIRYPNSDIIMSCLLASYSFAFVLLTVLWLSPSTQC